jgi:hypothetical protein
MMEAKTNFYSSLKRASEKANTLHPPPPLLTVDNISLYTVDFGDNKL